MPWCSLLHVSWACVCSVWKSISYCVCKVFFYTSIQHTWYFLYLLNCIEYSYNNCFNVLICQFCYLCHLGVFSSCLSFLLILGPISLLLSMPGNFLLDSWHFEFDFWGAIFYSYKYFYNSYKYSWVYSVI